MVSENVDYSRVHTDHCGHQKSEVKSRNMEGAHWSKGVVRNLEYSNKATEVVIVRLKNIRNAIALKLDTRLETLARLTASKQVLPFLIS